MPYYAYLDNDGKAVSPKRTLSPQEMEATSEVYVMLDAPMLNPIYDNDEFREMTAEELSTAKAEIATQAALSRTSFDKLILRRTFRALEIEEQLDALINSNPLFAKDWQETTTLNLLDEFTQSAIVAAKMTAEQLNAIKIKYAEIAKAGGYN